MKRRVCTAEEFERVTYSLRYYATRARRNPGAIPQFHAKQIEQLVAATQCYAKATARGTTLDGSYSIIEGDRATTVDMGSAS